MAKSFRGLFRVSLIVYRHTWHYRTYYSKEAEKNLQKNYSTRNKKPE